MLYETSYDRIREASVAATFERFDTVTPINMEALPPLASIDYMAFDGRKERLAALVEIKTRTTPHDQYPTYMVDKAKWVLVARTAAALGVHGAIAVGFADGVRVIDTSDLTDVFTQVGGRYDRADPNDEDLMYHVPPRRMLTVNEAIERWVS